MTAHGPQQSAIPSLPISSTLFTNESEERWNRLKSETCWNAIFASSNIGIALVDAEGRFIESNAALQEMLGYTEEALRTMTCFDITHPDDVLTSIRLHEEHKAGHCTRYQVEKRSLSKNNQVKWFHLTASCIESREREYKLVLHMMEDITEHKQMEVQLSKARRQLYWAREMERRCLARELHDHAVQTLLGISYQLVENQRDMHTQLPSVSTLDTLRQEILGVVAQLRTLISELRFTGLEEASLTAALESYVAALRCKQKMPTIKLLLPEREIFLSEPVTLCLFRIAQEALRNALQHAQANYVVIQLCVLPEEAVLSVYDDGNGFLMPTRLSTLVTSSHFGLVGMAERASLLHGQLTIDSHPREGTRVKVAIPLNGVERNNE